MTKKEDQRLATVLAVGAALQVTGITAYVPLNIIGPAPERETLLIWVMLTWIVAGTVGGTLLLRRLFRKWFA